MLLASLGPLLLTEMTWERLPGLPLSEYPARTGSRDSAIPIVISASLPTEVLEETVLFCGFTSVCSTENTDATFVITSDPASVEDPTVKRRRTNEVLPTARSPTVQMTDPSVLSVLVPASGSVSSRVTPAGKSRLFSIDTLLAKEGPRLVTVTMYSRLEGPDPAITGLFSPMLVTCRSALVIMDVASETEVAVATFVWVTPVRVAVLVITSTPSSVAGSTERLTVKLAVAPAEREGSVQMPSL